jgi:VanZ family protein
MKRAFFLLPALLYMGLIFWLSSRPAPESLQTWPTLWGLKAVHLVEYAILCALWLWGLAHATRWSFRRVALIAALLTFLWGVSDELHQSCVPGRTARVTDALTNLVAALLAAGGAGLVRRKAEH